MILKIRENIKLPYNNGITDADIVYDEESKNDKIKVYHILEAGGGSYATSNLTHTFNNVMVPGTSYWVSFDLKWVYGTTTDITITVGGTSFTYAQLINNKKVLISAPSTNLVITVVGLTPTDEYSLEFIGTSIIEQNYNSFNLIDGGAIGIKRQIKEYSDINKFKMSYTNSFKIHLDSDAKKYFKYIEIDNVINRKYDAVLEENGIDLIEGVGQLLELNGDIISLRIIEDINTFFKDIKEKSLKDINDNTTVDYSIGNLSHSLAFQHASVDRSYVNVHDNKSTVNYTPGTDRGLYDSPMEWNQVELHGMIRNDINFTQNNSYFIGEYQPKIFNRWIWDKIHSDMGVEYEGDIFNTLDWNSLLVHNNKDFNYNKDEIKDRTIKLKYADEYQYIEGVWDGAVNGYKAFFLNDTSTMNFKIPTSGGEYSGVDVNTEGFNPTAPAYRKFKIKAKVGFNTDDTFNDDETNTSIYAQGKIIITTSFKWTKKNSTISRADVTLMHSYSHVGLNTNPDTFEAHYVEYSPNPSEEYKWEGFAYLPRDYTDESELAMLINFECADLNYVNETADEASNNTIGQVYVKDLEIEMIPDDAMAPKDLISTRTLTDLLPNIKQSEYLRDIMNLFNLKYEFIDGKIHYYTTEEFYTSGEVIDITNRGDDVVEVLAGEWQPKYVNYDFDGNEDNKYIITNQTNKTDEVKIKNKFNINNSYGVNQDGHYIFNENYKNKVGLSLFNTEKEKDDKTYLSYLNVISNTGNSDVVYNYLINLVGATPGNVSESNYFVTSSAVGEYSTTGDMFTLYPYLKSFNGLTTPTANMLSRYGVITLDVLTNPNQRKVKGKFDLDGLNVKINDILQFKENTYIIESLGGIVKGERTDITMLKFNFNSNFNYNIDDVIFNNPYVNTWPQVISKIDSVVGSSYVGTSNTVSLEWYGLDNTSDIVINNVDSTTNVQFSFNGGGTWITIPTTYNVNIPTDDGSLSFLTRFNSSSSIIDEHYTFTQGSYTKELRMKAHIYHTIVVTTIPIGIIPTPTGVLGSPIIMNSNKITETYL